MPPTWNKNVKHYKSISFLHHGKTFKPKSAVLRQNKRLGDTFTVQPVLIECSAVSCRLSAVFILIWQINAFNIRYKVISTRANFVASSFLKLLFVIQFSLMLYNVIPFSLYKNARLTLYLACFLHIGPHVPNLIV